MTARYTVVYDGACTVCARFVRRLAVWDREHVFEIIPSQAPGTAERFPWIPPHAYADALQLIRARDNVTWQGAAALEIILRELPRARWTRCVFAVPFARGIADRLYRWFARNRSRFGCGRHCAR